jgi:hypothetical protein
MKRRISQAQAVRSTAISSQLTHLIARLPAGADQEPRCYGLCNHGYIISLCVARCNALCKPQGYAEVKVRRILGLSE